MDPNYGGAGAAIGAIFALYAVFAVSMLVFAVGAYLLHAFAFMSFFRKVGVEPWIAWVPYYNIWKLLEVGGLPGYWVLLAIIPYGAIAAAVFMAIAMYRIGIAFRKDAGMLVLGIFFSFIWAFILGGHGEKYEPELITQAGYPRPLAGYGSAAGPAPAAPPAA